MLILMSFSRCLWPPMKLKFKSTEGTLSGKNRSVWNQSTAEWRKIIFFLLWDIELFLLSKVNVYRTGFHKEFMCCVTSGHFHTRTYYTLNIFPPMPLPSSPLCPPVSLPISCPIRQRIRSFDEACTPEKV